MSFKYHITLKGGETRGLVLPNLKSKGQLLTQFKIESNYKTFDIKIVGKDTIVSYGEAVFYQTSTFDLQDKLSQIIDADQIRVMIKNLCTSKEANTVELTLTFTYTLPTVETGSIIYNNIYINLNTEGLSNIVDDLAKVGRYVSRIVWTSPNKLSTIEFVPQFESEPCWLEKIVSMADCHNQVVMDVKGTEFIEKLPYYSLVIPDNIEKLGVIVYGYHH